jgi:uncharacterized membrane protein YkvA (DUF1232 family)
MREKRYREEPDPDEIREDDDFEDDDEEEPLPIQRPRLRRRGRAEVRDREAMKQLIRDIPSFVKLLGRLARDGRVSRVDKGIVVATIAYLVMPMDFIPDWIPFLGQIDDIYLLALALDRLLNNAGIDLLLEHWDGNVGSLETALGALDKAASFLPAQVRMLVRSVLHER